MIKVIDIQNHIGGILTKKFGYDNYVEDNREEIEGHAFIISVRPLLTTGAMNYKNKLVNVDISYISKGGTHRENIEIADVLEDVFHLTLVVKDRELYIEDLSISEVDTVLNLGFTLNYNTEVITRHDVESDKDLGYEEEIVDEEGNVIDKGTIENMKELELTKGDDY